MSIKTIIPVYLRSLTDDKEEITLDGSTVGECLDQLTEQFPRMKKMLLDSDGNLYDYVSIFINREDAYPNELAKPLKDGDNLHILYVVAGG